MIRFLYDGASRTVESPTSPMISDRARAARYGPLRLYEWSGRHSMAGCEPIAGNQDCGLVSCSAPAQRVATSDQAGSRYSSALNPCLDCPLVHPDLGVSDLRENGGALFDFQPIQQLFP